MHHKITTPRPQRVNVLCQVCAKPFDVAPSNLARGNGKYCSRDCYYNRLGTPEQRFWKHVDRTGDCWIWSPGTSYMGHRSLKINGMAHGVHRFSYELHYGPVPDGLLVCHTCDVPRCVNPAHLYAGTPADNARDRTERKRDNAPKGQQHYTHLRPEDKPRGMQQGTSKLTDDTVLEIRALAASGMSQRVIAQRFGVDQSNISYIVRRKTWTHI